MEPPTRTPYDNDDVMLYKWANYYDQPVRYMLIIDGQYQPLIDRAYQLANQPLIEIYAQLTDPSVYPSPNIRLETDIGNMMADYYLSQGLGPQQVVDLVNNYYRDLGLEVSIDSVATLNNSISTWKDNYQRYLEATKRHFQYLMDLEQELASQPPLLASPLTVDSMTIAVTPRLRIFSGGQLTLGPIPLPEKVLDIWDYSILSPELPFLRYTAAEDLSKVWTVNLPPDLNTIITPNIYGDYTMVGTVLLPETLRRYTASTYTTMIYRFREQEITLTIPDTSDPAVVARVFNRIETHTPLVLTDPRSIKVSGMFVIYDFTYNDAILLDMILLQPVFQAYIFVDESSKPSIGDKIVIKYRGFEQTKKPRASAKATLSRGITTIDQELSLYNPESAIVTYDVPAGTPYVGIRINYADNEQVANQFLEVLRRLLAYYKKGEAERASVYEAFFGRSFAPIILESPVVPGQASITTIDHLTYDLARAAPQIFVKNYSKFCQGPYKPAIISPDYIKSWQEQVFTRSGVQYYRQVLPYPKDNPEIYIVCPSDRYPFPGVKANAKLDNRDRYPYIPCCYEEDQTGKAGSDYNRFYLGNTLQGRSRTRTHKIVTNKILEPGRLGTLSKSIVTLLSQDPDISSYELSRYGVDIGPNSLLHSVAFAVNDLGYNQAFDKEQYVRQLRASMANFEPGLVRQELYDLTDDEIRAKILDLDSFFDPNLFYRLVEERYQINLYVFYPPPNKGATPGGLELPRHRLFHVRAPRQRPTVLIIKQTGGGADALTQPQCELIVFGQQNQIYGTVFSEGMGQIIHQAMMSMNQLMTWSPDLTGPAPDIYSSINWETNFPNPVSQLIDPYGKVRALTFPYLDQLITVAIPPGQPLNLPSMTEPSRVDRQLVINLFGPPTEEDGGLWYSFGPLNRGFYVYTNDLGPDPLFDYQMVGQVSRVKLLKRLVRVLLQYILWTFQLSGMSVDQYMASCIIVQPTDQDNLSLYNLSKIKRILPEVTSLEEAIDYLNLTVPGLIVDGRIMLPDQRVYDGVRYYLQLYLGNTRPDQRQPIRTIEGLYEAISDFRQQQGVAIFLNGGELTKWIESITQQRTRIDDIKTQLIVDYSLARQPYIYRATDGQLYLIQNVATTFGQAIQVGVIWNQIKINLGFNPPSMDQPVPYLLYRLDGANQLFLEEDQSNGQPDYVRVLDYYGRYAAMLPL